MQLMSIKIGLLSVLLIKTCVRKKGGLGGFAPQTLTRSYYFEPPLSKKRSRATGLTRYRCRAEKYSSQEIFRLQEISWYLVCSWTKDQPRLHVVSGGNNIVMLAKEALAFLLFMFANLVLATALLVEFAP